MNGVEITENNTMKIGDSSVDEYLAYSTSSLFTICTEGREYYIAASFYRVFENELEIGESSLGVLEYIGREKEIFSNRED